MEILLKPTSQRIVKLATYIVNMSVVAGFILISHNLIIKTPIIAQEFRLAHNILVNPIITSDGANKVQNEVEMQFQRDNYNKKVRQRYKQGYIYDVDTGVKHIKVTRYYQGRPVRINIVEINRNLNPNLQVKPQLASQKLASKSTITSIAKRNNSLVAINGTFFKPQTGVPLGTLMIDKQIYTGPIYDRVAMGFFDNGYDMARVQLNASLKAGKNQVKIDNINQPRMLVSYVLAYTSEWGAYAPPSPKYGMQIAIENGRIKAISTSALAIPQNGYVIVGPSDKLNVFKQNEKVDVNIATNPQWRDVNHIISGGPYLVKNGEVFVDMTAQKLGAIGGRNPRSAIGYTADNELILIAVDGREHASIGMTLFELATYMKELGCVNAMNLDGGGSTVMYVKGAIVNNPAQKGGIGLSNALTISKI